MWHYVAVYVLMMMMMSGFVWRVINSPQTRYRSANQVGLQMSGERQRGESCGSQSVWYTVPNATAKLIKGLLSLYPGTAQLEPSEK